MFGRPFFEKNSDNKVTRRSASLINWKEPNSVSKSYNLERRKYFEILLWNILESVGNLQDLQFWELLKIYAAQISETGASMT